MYPKKGDIKKLKAFLPSQAIRSPFPPLSCDTLLRLSQGREVGSTRDVPWGQTTLGLQGQGDSPKNLVFGQENLGKMLLGCPQEGKKTRIKSHIKEQGRRRLEETLYASSSGVRAHPVPRATVMGWRHRQRQKQVIALAFLGGGDFAAAKEAGWYIGHGKRSRFS